MFRVFGAFLLVFSLLSIMLHLDATAEVFGIIALVCLIADLLLDSDHQHRARQSSRGSSLESRL